MYSNKTRSLGSKVKRFLIKRTLEFKNNRRGIVYVWALVMLAMVIYTFAWFSMGLVIMTFIDAVTTSMNFAPPWDSVVEFIRNCFLIHPIISLVGWFIYGILNSAKRDVDTWRTF